MRPIDEKKRIQQAARGDHAAFEWLVEQYQTPVYRLCLRMTNNPEDAADLTQESFLKAWKNLESFHFESAFSTWLYRLSTNTCLDFLRQLKRRPTVSLVTEDDEGDEQVMDVADPTPGPEEQVLNTLDREQLSAAMARLPEEQRQLLILRAVNGLSYGEIAQILGVKEGTIKSRLARARENLRKKLLQNGNFLMTISSKEQEGGGGHAL